MKQLIALLLISTVPLVSGAFYSTSETAEVIPVDHYRAYLGPQLFLSDEGGMNFLGHFDAGISDASSIRITMGVGTIDFHTGFFYKWVPYPDFGDQPAIGFKVGAELGRDGDNTILAARVHPLISKRFERPEGLFIPYASLPFGVTSYSDESLVPVQLVGGLEYKPEQLERIRFGGELGIEVHEAFSYINFYALIDIDGEEGIIFE